MKTLSFLFIILFAISCNVLQNTDASSSPGDGDCSEQEGPASKILFIGSGHTSENDLPLTFKLLSCSLKKKTEIYALTKDNFRFLNHSVYPATQDIINYIDWDYIILQNHGLVPSWKSDRLTAESTPYAQDLADMILANFSGTNIIYYQTAGRMNGDQTNCPDYPLVCDLSGHTQALAQGYEEYRNTTGGEIAYVGNAFLEVFEDDNSNIDPQSLWQQDGAHPSKAGTYLAASVLFARVFDQTPVGAMPLNELGDDEALYLQYIAAQTQLGTSN